MKAVAPASIPDWKVFVRGLADSDREWLEWQAYAFAGLLLVPRDPLARAYRDAVRAADQAGFDLAANLDVAKHYMATSIAKIFADLARLLAPHRPPRVRQWPGRATTSRSRASRRIG